MTEEEFIIPDEENTIIERKDVQGKIKKLENYIKKAENRFKEIDQKLSKNHLQGADQNQIQQGLAYYQLDTSISKQV